MYQYHAEQSESSQGIDYGNTIVFYCLILFHKYSWYEFQLIVFNYVVDIRRRKIREKSRGPLYKKFGWNYIYFGFCVARSGAVESRCRLPEKW